jgi:FMN reductase
MSQHLIIGIGGTTRAQSSAGQALRIALEVAQRGGAETLCFDGPFLANLPVFAPENPERTAGQRKFLDAVRRSDGLIIASPVYHCGISGLVKNAIDLIEDLRTDPRAYLDGRAVGCITTAPGWQGGGLAMASLRAIVHALRGWPTPFGATLNATDCLFNAEGNCSDAAVRAQLELVGSQVTHFAAMRRRYAEAPAAA